MSYNEWKRQVAHWRAQYGYPAEKSDAITHSYTPTKVKVWDKQCAKCNSVWKITRHHKGHEYIFAKIMEEKYAKRYIEFHPEDIVPLCERCHIKIHRMYESTLLELNNYLLLHPKPVFEELEKFRLAMVRRCENWLKRPMKKPSNATKRKLRK